MKPETKNEIQQELAKLHKTVQAILDVWNDADKQMIAVLLQNAAFNTDDCVGSTLESQVEKINKVGKALFALREFEDYHFVNWVCDQYDMIVSSCLMNEDVD